MAVRFQVASSQRIQYEVDILTEKMREKFLLQSNLLSSGCDNPLCSTINDRMNNQLSPQDLI